MVSVAMLFGASNPKVYAQLGDTIYNNVSAIDKLKDMKAFELYHDKMAKYVEDVKQTKLIGYAIENGYSKVDKMEYLNRLRKLAKQNDFYLRLAQQSYARALENEKSDLFVSLINSGAIDTASRKNEIIDYYYAHKEDINATGVIQNFLDEDAKLRALKEAEYKNRKTKKQLEEERLRRIREKDRREQEALEKKLEMELEKKKKELREEQKKELLKTI